MAHKHWDLVENLKNKRWFIHIEEGTPASAYPNVQQIYQKAIEKGVKKQALLSNSVLEISIKKALARPGETFSFPVVIEPTFDVRLTISPDKTTASLYIRKASDPKVPMDLKLISTVLNNSKLKDLDIEKIQKTITEFRDSSEMELQALPLSEGIAPSRGNDREFISIFEEIPQDTHEPILHRVDTFKKIFNKAAIPYSSTKFENLKLGFVTKNTIVLSFSPTELGASGIDVYGKEIPGLPGNDPYIKLSGSLSLGPTGVKTEDNGLLIVFGSGQDLHTELIPYCDAKSIPSISDDKLLATVLLECEVGAGIPLTSEFVLDTLKQKKITGKIDLNLINQTIEQIKNTGKSLEIPILKGIQAVKPGKSRYTWTTQLSPIEHSATVHSGERILLTEVLAQGSDGVNVFGEVQPASSAPEHPDPEHDDTILVEKSESTRIYTAAISGSLTFKENKLSISPSRALIKDIDETTGDINFPADLEITGSIHNGRTVRSGGNLKINGNAEMALVSADENLTMIGGIKGSGRGTVWAKKEIKLTFAENARLLAGQNILIENYCFQCTVKTNGKLIMHGNPAVLLGGNIRASQGVEVYELGSEKTLRTSISFGQNYLVGDQIEVSEKEANKIKETIEKIDSQMKAISKTNPQIHELRRKKLELMKRAEKITVRIFTLKEQFETHITSSIRVENTVYPGVILESHGRYYEVRERQNHVVFYFDLATGQIICKPIES